MFCNSKFVSQKIHKVRWRPQINHLINESQIFATGSWDDEPEGRNTVCLWMLNTSDEADTTPEFESLPHPTIEPKSLCQISHPGDVTDMQFVKGDLILAASSNGSLFVYKHHATSQTLSSPHSWPSLHHYSNERSCACTAIAYRSDDSVATAGEDGCIQLLQLDQKAPVRTLDNADSCTINSILFLKQNEIATCNSVGHIKIWDIREATNEPVRMLKLPGGQSSVLCMDKHPTQSHVLATAGQDQAVYMWDLRQDGFPVTQLNAHTSDILEVHFHPVHPDNMFTCSQDGSVWHWNASSIVSAAHKDVTSHVGGTTAHSNKHARPGTANPWLLDATSHRLEVKDVIPGNNLPVNSVHIVDHVLLCGTDGEQLHYTNDLVLN